MLLGFAVECCVASLRMRYEWGMSDKADPFSAPFGTLFGDSMTVARFDGERYDYPGQAEPLREFSFHPATHVLHYASECFEGLKAHRQADGSLAIFRLDDHVARFEQSAARLRLAFPERDLVRQMIIDAVEANAADTPPPPGSLYIRPTLIGTDANIGAAAGISTTTMLYVINSPVGDYFKGGIRPLTLLVEESTPRTTPQFGSVKSGANYAMALGITLDAKRDHVADQVLFVSDGGITETGAANFFMIDDNRLITRALDASFLHGVTRDSVITIARDNGYAIEERDITTEELVAWSPDGEVFLSGTAAVMAPVGTLIVDGEHVTVGAGEPGPNTLKVRELLTGVQQGTEPDAHGWLTPVAG